jgi:hypothetical protein
MNESLHLMAAFQLAVFHGVIGTLWEANDKPCADVAFVTSSCLQTWRTRDTSITEGLHLAIKELCDRWVKQTSEISSEEAVRKGLTPASEKSPRPGETVAQGLRDAESVEELPLYWVQYVHFGT